MEVSIPKKYIKAASTLVRPNSKDCLVIALAMRPKGVTQSEVIQLLGHPHRNIIKKLLETKQFKRVHLPDASRARRIRLVRR